MFMLSFPPVPPLPLMANAGADARERHAQQMQAHELRKAEHARRLRFQGVVLVTFATLYLLAGIAALAIGAPLFADVLTRIALD